MTVKILTAKYRHAFCKQSKYQTSTAVIIKVSSKQIWVLKVHEDAEKLGHFNQLLTRLFCYINNDNTGKKN